MKYSGILQMLSTSKPDWHLFACIHKTLKTNPFKYFVNSENHLMVSNVIKVLNERKNVLQKVM